MNDRIITLDATPRPFCTLMVLEALTEQQIEELAPIIQGHDPSDPDIDEALRQNALIGFESEPDGCMPADLGHYLQQNALPFVWRYSQCEDSGAGVEIYDPAEGAHTIRVYEEMFVLPLAEAVDPARVAKTQERIEWLNTKMNSLHKPDQEEPE